MGRPRPVWPLRSACLLNARRSRFLHIHRDAIDQHGFRWLVPWNRPTARPRFRAQTFPIPIPPLLPHGHARYFVEDAETLHHLAEHQEPEPIELELIGYADVDLSG